MTHTQKPTTGIISQGVSPPSLNWDVFRISAQIPLPAIDKLQRRHIWQVYWDGIIWESQGRGMGVYVLRYLCNFDKTIACQV